MTELLRPYAELAPLADLLRLGVFLAFLFLGLRIARAPEARRRARVGQLIAYVLGVTGAVGVTQIESWPFSNWALVHGLSSRRGAALSLEAQDASGRWYRVDFRALQPLAPEEFAAWFRASLDGLDAAGRARVGRFLLEKSETARRRFLGGGRVGANERLLGMLGAPYHFHFDAGKGWRSADDVPASPFLALRVLLLEWDVEERRADESRVGRRLLLDFHGAHVG